MMCVCVSVCVYDDVCPRDINRKDRFDRAVVVLGAVENDKVRLVAGVTKNFSDTVHAGELINFVAQQVGGKGGGRPDMAEAGGSDASKLDDAIESVGGWVAEHVG